MVEADPSLDLPVLTGFENHGGRTTLGPGGAAARSGAERRRQRRRRRSTGCCASGSSARTCTVRCSPATRRSPTCMLGWVVGADARPPRRRPDGALRAERLEAAAPPAWPGSDLSSPRRPPPRPGRDSLWHPTSRTSSSATDAGWARARLRCSAVGAGHAVDDAAHASTTAMPVATPPIASRGRCLSAPRPTSRSARSSRRARPRARPAARAARSNGTASSHVERRPRGDARRGARRVVERAVAPDVAPVDDRLQDLLDEQHRGRDGGARDRARASSGGRSPTSRARARPRRRTRGEPSASPKSPAARWAPRVRGARR